MLLLFAFVVCVCQLHTHVGLLAHKCYSDGLERTKELAKEYSNQAVEAILQLEQSDARDALVNLARQITVRKM